MDTASTLKGQLDFVANTLDQVIADVTPEVLIKTFPGSTIGAIAGIYAHAIFSLDRTFNVTIKGGNRLLESDGWVDKIGLRPPEGRMDLEWRTNATMDLDVFRAYAADVVKSASDYLAGASEADLNRMVEQRGRELPVAELIASFALFDVALHLGEIAALKGVQGLKGLPF